MGQAKLRGPREARVAEAIERNEIARVAEEQRRAHAEAEEQLARQAKLDEMTPEKSCDAVRIRVVRGSGGLRKTAMLAALGIAMLPDNQRGGQRHG